MWPTSTSDLIQKEAPGDEDPIAAVTALAFAGAEHSDGTESAIVERLRADGDLALSLVLEDSAGRIVGHIAGSPVTMDGAHRGWYGLGPVSVLPEHQGEGLGTALIRRALERLRAVGASVCVVLGEPRFYSRFRFEHDPGLRYRGVPAEYFQRLVFRGAIPRGEVAYARGFGG